MTGDEYQTLAHRTAATAGYTVMQALAVAGLGIAGEAGEVADLIKKEIGHGHPVDRQKILGELGDVLWYVAYVSTLYGLSLDHVMRANVDKLITRYPDGFSTERSINRNDEVTT